MDTERAEIITENIVEESSNGRLWAQRVLFLLVMVFSMCCLKLCAEDAFITPAQAKEKREKFVSFSKQFIGSPYVYGAVGPDVFDCSGLIYYTARESVKIQLPRTSKAIYNYCTIVGDEDREVGDLLFFKTTNSGTISHVGIYIGNNQFISAISDGPNTGVIVSSLNQDYWKTRYVCAGQFIKSGRAKGEPAEGEKKASEEKKTEQKSGDKTSEKSSDKTTEKNNGKTTDRVIGSVEHSKNLNKSFADSVVFDTEVAGGWSFVNPNGFTFDFKGVDVSASARYEKWPLSPGLGFMIRYNHTNQMFQIPVVLSANINDYIKLYAGPVFSFNNGKLGEKTIRASILPGIAGAEFATPAIKAGKTEIQFVQNISYSFFSELDGSALSASEMFGNGFDFSTGVRVTFPLSAVL